jgi:hypothetical protein
MLDRLSVGVHSVDVDSGDPRILRIVVEQIQKIQVDPDIIADSGDAVDNDPGFGAFARDLVRSKNRNALESLGYQLPGWDFDDAVGRYEGGPSWIGHACWPTSLGRWTKNCWRGMNI